MYEGRRKDRGWKMIVHKQGKETFQRYVAFGIYETGKAPLCVGSKGIYSGKSYYTHRSWKYVTCKKCLKKRIGGGK
jgi:hypothetical protein